MYAMTRMVDELSDATLNRLVAECEGDESPKHGGIGLRYSSDWLVAGPIIEREKINLEFDPDISQWFASYDTGEVVCGSSGSTPLIAAMRCYVASIMGNEIILLKEN